LDLIVGWFQAYYMARRVWKNFFPNVSTFMWPIPRRNPAQAHFVLPTTLCEFRARIDEPLMDELIAIQAAAAMEEGLVSPAHLVVDTFPCEQGSQRVTDATTLYKAQKKR
jgi:hypothetical protein